MPQPIGLLRVTGPPSSGRETIFKSGVSSLGSSVLSLRMLRTCCFHSRVMRQAYVGVRLQQHPTLLSTDLKASSGKCLWQISQRMHNLALECFSTHGPETICTGSSQGFHTKYRFSSFAPRVGLHFPTSFEVQHNWVTCYDNKMALRSNMPVFQMEALRANM